MEFPLRWESTGDQWWFASPIDWAAAKGHYDLVRQLLLIDSNHLIQLTSLNRTRRLETVWDDADQFQAVSSNRCQVAQRLFKETDCKRGKNYLIRAGYGGWLLYTAASAGDLSFIQELLERDRLLVFGEGEYGVTDILYAAAKSKNSEAFNVVLDFAISPRFGSGKAGGYEGYIGEVPSLFKEEMMNRAVHAAARGGNVENLKELLAKDGCLDVLAYGDAHGSTILHAAASKGQVEVVKYLTENFDICNVVDKQGYTALHIAANRGQLSVVEALITASPSSISLKNNAGETYLHLAASGLQANAFRRMDRQFEFMRQLVEGQIFRLQDIINEKNNQGQTALHTAIIGNIHIDLIELLMSVRFINVNARDLNQLTPFDHLRRRPHSASSDILSHKLVSAGGTFSCQDQITRQVIASRLRMEGNHARSPGTSFQLSDMEIFLYTGHDNRSDTSTTYSGALSACSQELTQFGSRSHSPNQTPVPADQATRRLSGLLLEFDAEEFDAEEKAKTKTYKLHHAISAAFPAKWSKAMETPISLREKYSSSSASVTCRRALSFSTPPSQTQSTKKNQAAGLKHGIMQAMPRLFSHRSFSNSAPQSLVTTPKHADRRHDAWDRHGSSAPSRSGSLKLGQKLGSFNKSIRTRLSCLGPTGFSVKESSTVIPRPQNSLIPSSFAFKA